MLLTYVLQLFWSAVIFQKVHVNNTGYYIIIIYYDIIWSIAIKIFFINLLLKGNPTNNPIYSRKLGQFQSLGYDILKFKSFPLTNFNKISYKLMSFSHFQTLGQVSSLILVLLRLKELIWPYLCFSYKISLQPWTPLTYISMSQQG